MTTLSVAAPAQSRTAMLIGAGALLGVVYTLTPLSVLSLLALTLAVIAAGRGLSPTESRWYWSILAFSIFVRLVAIALLCLTADPAHPFASFFGDVYFSATRNSARGGVSEGNEHPTRGRKINRLEMRISGKYSA